MGDAFKILGILLFIMAASGYVEKGEQHQGNSRHKTSFNFKNNSKKNSNNSSDKHNNSNPSKQNNQKNNNAKNSNPNGPSSSKEQGIPSQLFGLTRKANGTWKNSSGVVVYNQARVYQGGKESKPLPVLRKGGCKYDPNKVVPVKVDSNKYPASALHIYIALRNGVPKVLHINRNPDYDLRTNSLKGIPSNSTNDRDEFPFALSNEAVIYNRKTGTSDIAFIPFSDNRGSGSSMGNQLSDWCQGQAFTINLVPAR